MGVVFFTQRVEVIESYGERRDCADQRIAKFITACGFLPVPVPNNPSVAEKMTEELHPDGIVLTGGNSLVKYGGNAPERDETDRTLIEMAVEKAIPLYGFCRGMQSILDYYGCNLINVQGHVAVRHVVSGLEESREVNSYHNQACVEFSTDQLEVVLRTDDGIIEKIRHMSLPIVATMWHPEREDEFRDSDIQQVKSLFWRK